MVSTDGHWFVDGLGRRVLLRGVNLGGSTKVPTSPDGRTHIPTDFRDHRTVSFVGRPFPIEEVDEHFMRLRHWGFNCLRFLTTWEAIEHAGPGQYDEVYLDYATQVIAKAGEYGFYVFIDPHQDVWSRMSGGDGAPGWTLELAGFDIANLDAAEAAITQQHRGDAYGTMVWVTNTLRLASATMFTLFFGGARFAPSMRVEGRSIETYLQEHFINALLQLAARVKDLPHVLGYDSLNEPSRGYLSIPQLSSHTGLVLGGSPNVTAFGSMVVGAGVPLTVPYMDWEGTQLVTRRSVTLNPNGVSAWRSDADDIWRKEGVWEKDANGEARLLRDDYFGASDFDFFRDGVRPFAQRFAEAIRAVHPDTYLFIESEPSTPDHLHWENAREQRIVNASHWYDTLTLLTKRYTPSQAFVWGKPGEVVSGVEAVQENFARQLGDIKAQTATELEGVPTLIGEFGVPFDINERRDFETEQFDDQSAALASYYDALDENLLHSTLWNYTADNTNATGDGWNGEDLSIFSQSQRWNPYDLDSGARGLDGFCRPTFRAVIGTPLYQRFNYRSGDYTLRVDIEPSEAASEIYIPRYQYQHGYTVDVSSGVIEHDFRGERILWRGAAAGEQTLTVTRTPDE